MYTEFDLVTWPGFPNIIFLGTKYKQNEEITHCLKSLIRLLCIFRQKFSTVVACDLRTTGAV